MSKAIISNKIYMKLPGNIDITKQIMSELTYKISKSSYVATLNKVEVFKTYSLVNPDILVLPQGRTDLIPSGYTIEDRRIDNFVPFPSPLKEPREHQVPVLDEVVGSCFINAKPGWGKTITALLVAEKLQRKTLVVTHTVALRDQWIKEAQEMFGVPIGIIGSSKFDIEDHCIVIGNVHSVAKKLDHIDKEFGLVIMDEAHHTPASTFTNIVDRMHARFKIGLSGTMERLDGKHILFKDYFGPIVLKPEKANVIDPEVHIIKTNLVLPGQGEDWASRMSLLMYDPAYHSIVNSIAQTYNNLGHTILIPADRVDFLDAIGSLLGEKCAVVHGKNEADREQVFLDMGTKYNYLAGNRNIFSEGVSINILSCILLVQPSGNPIMLEQLVARINRQHPSKEHLTPIIVDLWFKGSTATKQNRDRLAFYTSQNWRIKYV